MHAILVGFLCLGLLSSLSGCVREDPAAGAPLHAPNPVATAAPTPAPTPEPTPTPPTQATLAVCGDAMSHMPVINDARDPETGAYEFTSMLSGAQPYIESADYAVVNLETVLAGGPKYSGYPRFHAPDSLAHSLKEVGFDLLLTANNHSLDQGYHGLARTLDVLDETGLAHVGTHRQEEAHAPVLADVGGISVAFLGYSYGTNGLPVPQGKEGCIDLFNTDYLTSLRTPDPQRLATDLAAARATGADLVAVMIHWGVEYQTTQNAYQEEVADLLIANGADLVLGGHSHVPQPLGMRTVTTETGELRTGFVCYSLGNFISAQYMQYCDITAVLTLNLEKNHQDGTARVSGWSYAPMLVVNRGEQAQQRFQILDIEAHLAETPDPELQAKLEQAQEDVAHILGPRQVTLAEPGTE